MGLYTSTNLPLFCKINYILFKMLFTSLGTGDGSKGQFTKLSNTLSRDNTRSLTLDQSRIWRVPRSLQLNIHFVCFERVGALQLLQKLNTGRGLQFTFLPLQGPSWSWSYGSWITEILLKVTLNAITLILTPLLYFWKCWL